jgi:membrane-associated phospholipid phosphatase
MNRREAAVRRIGWVTAPFVCFVTGYYGAPHLAANMPAWDLSLAIDRSIPCVSGIACAYLVGLVLPVMPAWFIPLRLLPRASAAYIALIAMATLGFLLLPTDGRLLRAQCGDPTWTLEQVYRLDAARNLFPSLHVGFATLAALCLRHAQSRWSTAAECLAAIQVVTVCLVKQHVLADAVAGAMLAFAAYSMCLESRPETAIQRLLRRNSTSRRAVSAKVGSCNEPELAARAVR